MTKEQFIMNASSWLAIRLGLSPLKANQTIKELVGRFGEFTFADEVRPPKALADLMAVVASKVMNLSLSGKVVSFKTEDPNSKLNDYVAVPKAWWEQVQTLLDEGMLRVKAEQAGKESSQVLSPNTPPNPILR